MASFQSDLLETSIFPERDNATRFIVYEESASLLYRTPLGYNGGSDEQKLKPLKHYIEQGLQCTNVTVLVCVKSFGSKKTGKSITQQSPSNRAS